MAQAIKDYYSQTGRRVGFKPAGGIKTVEEALGYVALIGQMLGDEWLTPELFRIGASSLLDGVLKELDK
jgi:deoxyribose-phosphate aldolase